MHKLMIRMGAGVFAALALVAVLGVLAWNGAQPVQAQQSPTAMRTFSPMPVAPGGMVTVTVSVTNIDGPWAVTETLPAGFTSALSDVDTSTAGKQIRVRSAGGASVNYDVTASSTVGSHDFMGTVTYRVGDNAPQNLMVPTNSIEVMAGGGTTPTRPTGDYSVSARPVDPGEPAQITLKFMNPMDLDIDQFITFVVEDDMGVPSSINPSTVSITGMGTEDDSLQTAPPNGVIVEEDTDAETYEITVFIGDMSTAADEATEDGLAAGAVTVVFRQNAGFTNRTEGGTDDWSFFTATTGSSSNTTEIGSYTVPFLVELSSYKDGRGEEITAFAYGFKNGTTVRFWRDQDGDGVIDTNEPDLCNATASGDDIAECTFTLANPPFVGGEEDSRLATDPEYRGANYINAVDGRGNTGTKSRLHLLELEPSITITPKQGARATPSTFRYWTWEGDRISWHSVCPPGRALRR